MAVSSLLTLLDDIASVLDDVASMTKVATQKTAGVLGDDLALNAQQVAGVRSNREIPVVFAVAKGSALNKLILVPAALAISALAPWAIQPLLMLGGAYLCFEGFEKVVHKFGSGDHDGAKAHARAVADPEVDVVVQEKEKIRGAIRTDFILSGEIVVIALGTVADQSLLLQLGVLIGISVVMTVGVYGLVAIIIKLDDLGTSLLKSAHQALRSMGQMLLDGAPYLMRALGILGTAAMFLVGGGIMTHGIPFLHHWAESLGHAGGLIGTLSSTLLNGLVGIATGALVFAAVMLFARIRRSA